jgi:hypothetical protein
LGSGCPCALDPTGADPHAEAAAPRARGPATRVTGGDGPQNRPGYGGTAGDGALAEPGACLILGKICWMPLWPAAGDKRIPGTPLLLVDDQQQ